MTEHPIPLAALDSSIAILGRSGRGKTYVAKGVVELLLELGRRVVVLDPLGHWWGLRTLADGAPGFPIAIFGGPHADVAIDHTSGRALGRLLAERPLSAVIDMGMMRKAEQSRLIGDLAEELFTLGRDPLWLVLEEADAFAPQQPMGDDSTRVLGEIDRIARRGRARGFRLISITQRAAKLHKDVLTQIGTLIAMGVTSPQDREAVKSWVEGNADRDQAREVYESLASLPVGEGWVWAPDHDVLKRVRFPRIRTLDTSKTPEVGETRRATVTLAEVDVSAIKADLERQEPSGPQKRAPKVDAKALEEADRCGYERGYADGLGVGFDTGVARLRERIEQAMDLPDSFMEITRARDPEAAAALRDAGNRMAGPPRPRPEVAGPLPGAARKMLAVLDTNPPVARTWGQVAMLAGLKARGGHFNAGRKALIERALIQVNGSLIRINVPSAGAPAPATDPAALVEMWAGVLSGAAPKILRHLHAQRGRAHTRASIAADLGMQPRGGHWNAAWKELRDNGLVAIAGEAVRLDGLFTSAGGDR